MNMAIIEKSNLKLKDRSYSETWTPLVLTAAADICFFLDNFPLVKSTWQFTGYSLFQAGFPH